MVKLILDFSKVKYFSDIHKIIKDTFKFPDYYGENLDALWDCLDYYTDEELIIKISGFAIIESRFGDYTSKIKEVFKRASSNFPNIKFEYLS